MNTTNKALVLRKFPDAAAYFGRGGWTIYRDRAAQIVLAGPSVTARGAWIKALQAVVEIGSPASGGTES